MSSELETYITDARANGLSDEEIRNSLVLAGWDEKDIEQALAQHVSSKERSVSSDV